MATIEETKDWKLINENLIDRWVKGPNWIVYSEYSKSAITPMGEGYTPYAAWFNAFVSFGFTKYLAHDLTIERLGVKPEPPNRPILA